MKKNEKVSSRNCTPLLPYPYIILTEDRVTAFCNVMDALGHLEVALNEMKTNLPIANISAPMESLDDLIDWTKKMYSNNSFKTRESFLLYLKCYEFFQDLVDRTDDYFLSDYVEEIHDYVPDLLSQSQYDDIIKERDYLKAECEKLEMDFHDISCQVAYDNGQFRDEE